MIDLLLLLVGLAVVIGGANFLVDGAASLAKRWGVSQLVIGLTIVAFGTSAPELTVNIFSALTGVPNLAIGNILGSNIANILLILGVTAIIYPLSIQSSTKWKEIPFSFLAALVLGFMANDIFLDQAKENVVTRIDGLVLLSFFAIFMVYTIEMARNTRNQDEEEIVQRKLWICFLWIIGGLLGLFFGGELLVNSAVSLAQKIGISEKVIGLTIVAVGTSLPELATSVVAAYKKNADIAVGNVVGSNIFNIFFILGITAVIKPLPFDATANLDIGLTILTSFLLFITSIIFKINYITRIEGVFFLLFYTTYIVYLLV